MSLNIIAATVCQRLGLTFQAVFNEEQFERNLPNFAIEKRIDFLPHGNADYEFSNENVGNHYQKGQAGDWKNHLINTHLDEFQKLYPELFSYLRFQEV